MEANEEINITAPAVIVNIILVVVNVSFKAPANFSIVNERYDNPKINDAITPTAAASVGVATPKKIDPSTAIIINNGGKSASRSCGTPVLSISLFLSSLLIGGPKSGLIIQRTII